MPTATKEDVELLLPGKTETCVHKLASKTLYYSDVATGEPLLIDLNGKGDLLPTVFGLWRAPNLLPRVYVPSPASKFLCRGADLMWPGTVLTRADAEHGWPRDQKRAIYALGNPAAFAVGLTQTTCPPPSRSGISVRVLHIYGDCLWKVAKTGIPNPGFGKGIVLPLEREQQQSGGAEEKFEDDDRNDEINDQAWSTGYSHEENQSAQEVDETKTDSSQDSEGSALIEQISDVEVNQAPDAEDNAEGVDTLAEQKERSCADSQAQQDTMDRMIEKALWLALKFRLTQAELPLVSDQLLGHMEAMNSYPQKLDMGRSSWKKWKTFIKGRFVGFSPTKVCQSS